MKKKRILPMCLCLVLALGLSACNDLEDLLPSSGDDEMGEASDTETGDTGDGTEPTNPEGPSESVPTYSIKITDPSGDISLEVGDSKDIEVLLVTTVDNTDSGVAGTASEVTLYSSDSSVVSIEGLTITALDVGDAVITATWTEHGVTSSGLAVTVTEPVVTPNPDVITYKVEITSPETGKEIEINTETVVSVNLITITNGEEGEPVSATSSDVTITESGSSSILTINESNLSITGTSTGTTSIIATWTEHDVNSEEVSITIVDSNQGGDPEPSEPVISYGIEITSPTGSASIEVDEPLTISVALITYSDNTETSRDTTTTTGVTLAQSSTDGGEVAINGLTITGKTAGTVTITATWTEQNVSDSVTITVTEPIVETITYKYVITIKNYLGEDMGTFPEGKSLYAAGSINSTYYDESTGYWTYGDPYLLEANADYTAFTLTLDYVPEVGREFKIYLHDNSNTGIDDIWSYEVAYHAIEEYDVSLADGQTEITYELGLWSYFSSWDKALAQEYPEDEEGSEQGGGSGDFVSYTTTVQIVNSNGTTFETAYDNYCVYVQSNFDNWGGDNGIYGDGSDGHKMTNNNDGTYSYTFTTLPDAGTYTFNVYPGDASGNSWKAAFTSYELTVTGLETGEYVAETKTSTSSYSDWNSIFATGADETFYIVFLDASGLSSWTGSMTINSGESCFNGNTYCSATQTKDGSSRIAWYSSAATLGSNATAWFNLTDGTNWMNTGDITIPDNSQGTPVYVAIGWFSGWTEGASWNADQTGTGWQYMSSGTTIDAFVQSLTSSN